MKSDAIKLLANKENIKAKNIYNALLKIYSEFAGPRAIYVYQLGYTPGKLENLKYEVRKHFGITEKDIALSHLHVEEVSYSDGARIANMIDEWKGLANPAKPLEELNSDIEDHNVGGKTSDSDSELITEGEIPEGKKTLEDVNSDIQKHNVPGTDSDPDSPLASLPEYVSAAVKLRDEYPFLDDENTPMELKALVTDKFSAYRKYAAQHAELLKAADENEAAENLYRLAKGTVASYQLNQDIKAELDFYRDSNGKVLGKVASLANLKITQEIGEMTEAELVKHRNNALKSVSKYEKAADKKELLKAWKFRLKETERRLKDDYNYQLDKK